jgi:hypothetical protein
LLAIAYHRSTASLADTLPISQEIGPCVLPYGGVPFTIRIWRSHRPEAGLYEQFTDVLVARAYECAVLETNPAHMARRIDDALRALEQRVGSTVRIESTENEAIESTRNALAVLRCEWFEGLSEAMNVVPQKALLKSNLFRNSQGKTELLGTFPDADSARARLPGHLAISSGYYVICDQTGERLFAERAPEGD